jgi:hypothetical protein
MLLARNEVKGQRQTHTLQHNRTLRYFADLQYGTYIVPDIAASAAPVRKLFPRKLPVQRRP